MKPSAVRKSGLGFASPAVILLLAACTSADDEGRPGFPRTPRTPIAGAPYPYASPDEVGLSDDRIWWFKERLYSRVVARRVVGAEILVVKDRRIVLHQAMGWADRERLIPLERNAIFRIGSMTSTTPAPAESRSGNSLRTGPGSCRPASMASVISRRFARRWP
jgi:CubicO group peptidase (beta-lactamase class C family)